VNNERLFFSTKLKERRQQDKTQSVKISKLLDWRSYDEGFNYGTSIYVWAYSEWIISSI